MQNQDKSSLPLPTLSPSGTATYLIVGNGRLARHISFYLSRHFKVENWNRRDFDSQNLSVKLEHATHLLLAISDSAIEGFFAGIAPHWGNRPRVHFSGALISEQIPGAHPLSPFGLNALDSYSDIPFVCDDGFEFREFFPGLENPVLKISPLEKIKYHALVSLAANLTTHLWQSTFHELERLNFCQEIQPDLIRPLLQNSLNNFLQNPNFALTGAVARKDFFAVSAHLESLKGSPLFVFYSSFVQQQFPEFRISNHEGPHAESNRV